MKTSRLRRSDIITSTEKYTLSPMVEYTPFNFIKVNKAANFPNAINEGDRIARNMKRKLEVAEKKVQREIDEERIRKNREEIMQSLTEEHLKAFRPKFNSKLPSYAKECYGFDLPHKVSSSPECFTEVTEVLLEVKGETVEDLIEKETEQILKDYFRGYKQLVYTSLGDGRNFIVKVGQGNKKFFLTLKELKDGISRCKQLKDSSGLKEKEEDFPLYISVMDSVLLWKLTFNYKGQRRSYEDTLTPEKKTNELDLKFYPTKGSLKRKVFLKKWMQQRDINRILEKVAYEEVENEKKEKVGEVWLSRFVVLTSESKIIENCKRCYEIYNPELSKDISVIKTNKGEAENDRISGIEIIEEYKGTKHILPADIIIDEVTEESLGLESVIRKTLFLSRWFTSREFKEKGTGLLTYKYNGKGTKGLLHSLTKSEVRRYWKDNVLRVFYYREGVGIKTQVEIEKEGKIKYFEQEYKKLVYMEFFKETLYRIRTVLKPSLGEYKGTTLTADLERVKWFKIKKPPYAIYSEECRRWLRESKRKENQRIEKEKEKKKIKIKFEDLPRLVKEGFFKEEI